MGQTPGDRHINGFGKLITQSYYISDIKLPDLVPD